MEQQPEPEPKHMEQPADPEATDSASGQPTKQLEQPAESWFAEHVDQTSKPRISKHMDQTPDRLPELEQSKYEQLEQLEPNPIFYVHDYDPYFSH